MNRIKIGVLAATLLLPLYAAAHDGKCAGRDDAVEHITTVESAISNARFVGNPSPNKKKGGDFERSNLLGKALAAKSYVLGHEYPDAMGKLDDIVTKVSSLLDAAKEKVDAYDGQYIVDMTIEAMYCIGDLQ